MIPFLILVIGAGPRHGKTEARKIIAELLAQPGASCSQALYAFADAFGTPEMKKWSEDKYLHRSKLVTLGNWLTTDNDDPFPFPELLREGALSPVLDIHRNPAALISTLAVTGHTVIDGVRRQSELDATREACAFFRIPLRVVYVVRPGLAPEDDNTEIAQEEANATIINDGTLEDLRAQIEQSLPLIGFQKNEPKEQVSAAAP
jgi:hypothetical protein